MPIIFFLLTACGLNREENALMDKILVECTTESCALEVVDSSTFSLREDLYEVSEHSQVMQEVRD